MTPKQHNWKEDDRRNGIFRREDDSKFETGIFWKASSWVFTTAIGLLLLLVGYVASDMNSDIKTLEKCAKDNRENIVELKSQYQYIIENLQDIKLYMKEHRTNR